MDRTSTKACPLEETGRTRGIAPDAPLGRLVSLPDAKVQHEDGHSDEERRDNYRENLQGDLVALALLELAVASVATRHEHAQPAENAGEEAAKVGKVVQKGHEAQHEVENGREGELQQALPGLAVVETPVLEKLGPGGPEDAKNAATCTDADGAGRENSAHDRAHDPGEHEDVADGERSELALEREADGVQAQHVEGVVDDASVEEDGGDEPVPLAVLEDEVGALGAEREQRLHTRPEGGVDAEVLKLPVVDPHFENEHDGANEEDGEADHGPADIVLARAHAFGELEAGVAGGAAHELAV
eukprot:CAMPEP_0202040986 /NCGR_PEP_ID=MMETSP0962-20130828/22633_1 /ASSEMBLY_ACC=CAM_ASM_000488 /TAXON_ID=4773 /ORGANISM="Schizochytrium aggregatum, Strain ATCC28209" /LENGTH=300 /DNA_ID=CAMNT_0048605289 /DNA_START=200 /DNA_END=1099 /DNA_ORIENTATION=+